MKVLLYCKREFKHDDKIVKAWYDSKHKTFFSSEFGEEEYVEFIKWCPLPNPPTE